MGQKINPLGYRIGVTEPHRATWFARGNAYGKLVAQDHFIRDFLKRRFKSAAIEKITSSASLSAPSLPCTVVALV